MNDILFVSEAAIPPELELARDEISHYGYSLSFPIQLSKVLDYLKATTTSIVLINAENKKIEAYELCKTIKDNFRGAIKVFVYLPKSNPNEGSRFGLANAEVEDEYSIKDIVSKLPQKDIREYILDENIISIYGLNGGCGSSTLSILIAYVLDYYNQTSLLLESSNTLSIKKLLDLEDRLPLLMRDRGKEFNQAKDYDWFSGFISRTSLIPNMAYLNLFEWSRDKDKYLEQTNVLLGKITNKLNGLIDKNSDGFEAQLFGIANSLKLLLKDLEGNSYSLFDELIQLGSKTWKCPQFIKPIFLEYFSLSVL